MGSNYLTGMIDSFWNDSRVVKLEKKAPNTLNSLNAIEFTKFH